MSRNQPVEKISVEQKAKAVISVVLGHRRIEELAAALDVDAGEVASWKSRYLAAVAASLEANESPKRSARVRRAGVAVGTLALAICLVFSSRVWSIPSADEVIDCSDGTLDSLFLSLVCFASNTPAKANDVNYNFEKLSNEISGNNDDIESNGVAISNNSSDISNKKLTCQTKTVVMGAGSVVQSTVTCDAGYVAVSAGFEPGVSWDDNPTWRVGLPNAETPSGTYTDSDKCYCFTQGVVADAICTCTCCKVI